MSSWRYYYLCLILKSLLLVVSACSVSKENKAELPAMIYEEPHILIMTLEAENNKNRIEVKALQQSLVKGMMKKAHLDHSELQAGDWKATVVNNKEDILEWTKLENPLLYRAEYINDAGILQTKAVKRDKGETSIRLPIEGAVDRIIIERISEGNNELLLEIELNSL